MSSPSNPSALINVGRANSSVSNINARRSGSSASIVQQPSGKVVVERRVSGANLYIEAKKRISSSTIPSILTTSSTHVNVIPVIDANEAVKRSDSHGKTNPFVEHLQDLEYLSEKYCSHIDLHDASKSCGLTKAKAASLLVEYGPNVLTPPARLPLWMLFLLQFTNLLIVLLLIVATLCIILYLVDMSQPINLYLGVLLYIVIFFTCYETFAQEAKSDDLMAKFSAMVPLKANVIRDGVMAPIPAMDIVIGDIIRLQSGDKVPADCRVIYNQGMKTDQSSITGESDPVEVHVIAADANALEARNIIFNGSLIVDGACLALVIRTGDATLIGTMVELTGDVGKNSSTLKADMEYFVKYVAVFSLIQAVIIFVVGCARGLNPITVFVQGFIVIMIANVPQGLPTTVTACLAIVAERMGHEKVFIKKLDIIETLGSCTLICTDKTGTLTLNLMSVANTWYHACTLNAGQFEIKNYGDKDANIIKSQLTTLMNIATLCSRVVMEKKVGNSELTPNGDATELGLYRFFSKNILDRYGIPIDQYRSMNPKVWEIPFNSSNKWQMSIHALASDNGKEVMYIKGAPDVLLSKCSHYINAANEVVPIDAEFNNVYTKVYEDFGGCGERVLGFAYRDMDRTVAVEEAVNAEYKDILKEELIGKGGKFNAKPLTNLIFAGLITLMDPPRAEVPQAIIDCHTAGVKVVMVTGDHPLTAASIARKIGLITHPTRDVLAKQRGCKLEEVPEADIKAVVVHGQEIPAMTDDDWKILVSKDEIVFARTSPEQKLKIVKEFTAAGNVTAMTGDGVNDSPALKQAAIGIAMGMNGSEVAKEAGDIILQDDNFASIVVGIREGRLLFANLKKSVAYTLCHLTPEVIPIVLWSFVGIPQPMGSLLCLCIDLLTELLPATSLAFEKQEANIMNVPPRNVKTDKLTSLPLLFYSYFQAGLIVTGGCLFAYFRQFNVYGVSANDLFTNNSRYFPSANGDDFVTHDGSGRVYSPADQKDILWTAQAIWYIMIVCGQAAHIWVVRTSTVSIFTHGFFCNQYTNYGVCCAIALGCFVIYCPGLIDIVQARTPSSIIVLEASVLVLGCLWAWAEGRKAFTRAYPEHWVNKYLAW